MSFALAKRPVTLPLATRGFLLAACILFLSILGAGGVGGRTADDHGNAIDAASDLSLGSSIDGRIDPVDDSDVFKLDLSEASGTTDVWIYTTGDLDTVGVLSDGDANRLAANDDSFIVDRWTNFHLRASLAPGIYYVTVLSYRNEYAGGYTLHAQAVTEPGSAIDTATRLSFDLPIPGTIDTADGADYFRLELAESKDLVVYAASVDAAPVDAVVLDSWGTEIATNVYPYPDPIFGLPRLGFRIRDDFGPGTYYVKIFTQPGVDAHPVPYTVHAFEDVRYADFIDECGADTRLLNAPLVSDSLYACQWGLNNRDGEDINVEPVWAEEIKGEGVNVAVVDGGMSYTHEDLRDNVDTSRNHDYTGGDDIYTPFEHHGTHVAGIIAARDNDVGIRGVAPRATVYGYNFLVETTTLNQADAMTRNRDATAVSNNGWGHPDGPWLGRANAFWELAVEVGITSGYGGKGTFYAFAGGNGGRGHRLNPDGTLVGGDFTNAAERGDDSNLDEFANFYGVSAVCAVNDRGLRSSFSEKGANLWVCAPSNDSSGVHRSVLTTENSDRYYEEFGGTSASTSMVSGVAALMRSANPNLTWRDLKLILAASARKNDPENPGWEDGARRYRADSDEDRYHFNHEYGFGVVDAEAAVDLAREWTTVPPLMRDGASSSSAVTIPAPGLDGLETVTTGIVLNTGIRFTEFVEINADFSHPSLRDMEIELESPSGAVSKLAVPFNTRHYTHEVNDETMTFLVPLDGDIRFGSARHLGEDPNGEWKLRLTDHFHDREGTLRSWSIRVYGHESPPASPSVDLVEPGPGSLTVVWSAPNDAGSSMVTAYDLRYVQSAAGGVDSDWIVAEDAWTAVSGGSLEYAVASLAGGVQYDVQVRAVNRVGAGLWSGTVTGTPMRAVAGACETGRAVAGPAANRWLVSDCNALLAARDALAGTATLNWSAGTPMANWQGVTLGGSPRRVMALDLPDEGLTGAIPAELSRLARLERLVLRRNQLTGAIPASLGNLVRLEEMSLWGNRLSGPIPTSLGKLPNLKELYLSQNRLTGPIPVSLGSLANLRELSLWRNQLTGPLPAELGRLTGLRRLVLSDNRFTGTIPAGLGNLVNLRSLSLWGNRLTGPIPAELGNLANLRELYLSENELSGPMPASLGSLAKLQALSIWRNGLTGRIPAELDDLANLERLLLRENRFSECVPKGLRDVGRNDFDDLDLPFCDALLTGLAMRPGSLVQPFDPYRTGYTALSSEPRVTVIPFNEHNATVMFFDRNRREIPDADGSSDGHQIDLGKAITFIRVEVTSPDGVSTYAYDIAVSRVPGAPSISETLSGNEYLTVSWAAPEETGGSDIVSYDLRYVQTAGEETMDFNWVVLEDVWTATGGGDLEYAVKGLTAGARYDVQVRAVSRTGAGFWSETATESVGPSVCVIGGAVTDETNVGLISDCEALLAARDKLAGTGSLDWSADTPVTDWEGVTVGGSPRRVTRLYLHAKGLNGTIPPELGKLLSLQRLYLYNNDLTGQIPAELGDLFNLAHLNLRHNRLTGPIPPELGGLGNLQRLLLHDNRLDGSIPSALGSLSNLRWLWLSTNQLSGTIPPELGRLSVLAQLNLHTNRLSGRIPHELAGLDNLQRLRLAGNRLTGCVPSGLRDVQENDLYRLGLPSCP